MGNGIVLLAAGGTGGAAGAASAPGSAGHRMPSVVVIPGDELFAKNIGTIEQIRARGGPVVAVTNTDIPDGLADAVLRVPASEPELDPILLGIPLQLFAYHLAAALGRDIDKPRNLAKSVTVE